MGSIWGKKLFSIIISFSSNFLLISALFTVVIPRVRSYYSHTIDCFIDKKGYFSFSYSNSWKCSVVCRLMNEGYELK